MMISIMVPDPYTSQNGHSYDNRGGGISTRVVYTPVQTFCGAVAPSENIEYRSCVAWGRPDWQRQIMESVAKERVKETDKREARTECQLRQPKSSRATRQIG